jgi:hypothetical protein
MEMLELVVLAVVEQHLLLMLFMLVVLAVA